MTRSERKVDHTGGVCGDIRRSNLPTTVKAQDFDTEGGRTSTFALSEVAGVIKLDWGSMSQLSPAVAARGATARHVLIASPCSVLASLCPTLLVRAALSEQCAPCFHPCIAPAATFLSSSRLFVRTKPPEERAPGFHRFLARCLTFFLQSVIFV